MINPNASPLADIMNPTYRTEDAARLHLDLANRARRAISRLEMRYFSDSGIDIAAVFDDPVLALQTQLHADEDKANKILECYGVSELVSTVRTVTFHEGEVSQRLRRIFETIAMFDDLSIIATTLYLNMILGETMEGNSAAKAKLLELHRKRITTFVEGLEILVKHPDTPLK